MTVTITARIAYRFANPTAFLLQMEAANIPEQHLSGPGLRLSASEHCARVAGEDAIGERIWLRCHGDFSAEYAITADIRRSLPDIAQLTSLPPHELPGECVTYLFDSQFCPADRFQNFVEAEFGGTQGGERIAAIREWVAQNYTYAPGSSNATTTALDTFVERRGVCRDFAHLVVTLARASAIPARYVSCYAPGVEPQDFHAVAEVFLHDFGTPGGTGSWHIVDSTAMANPAQTVKIGVGRDAADVSFLTSYGNAEMLDKQIAVSIG